MTQVAVSDTTYMTPGRTVLVSADKWAGVEYVVMDVISETEVLVATRGDLLRRLPYRSFRSARQKPLLDLYQQTRTQH